MFKSRLHNSDKFIICSIGITVREYFINIGIHSKFLFIFCEKILTNGRSGLVCNFMYDNSKIRYLVRERKAKDESIASRLSGNRWAGFYFSKLLWESSKKKFSFRGVESLGRLAESSRKISNAEAEWCWSRRPIQREEKLCVIGITVMVQWKW